MLESQGAGHLLSHSTIGILPTNTGSYIHYIRVGGGYYSLSFIPPLRYQTLELGGYPQSHSTIGILVSRAGRLSLPLIPQLEYQYLELGGYHSLSFHNWDTPQNTGSYTLYNKVRRLVNSVFFTQTCIYILPKHHRFTTTHTWGSTFKRMGGGVLILQKK